MDILRENSLDTTDWQPIIPNSAGDWIAQRNAAFGEFHPLAISDATGSPGEPAPIFVRRTLGLVTSRDAWCYNSSQRELRENIRRSVDYYNDQVSAFQKTNPSGRSTERIAKAKAFIQKDPRRFHWHDKNFRDLANGRAYSVDESGFRISAYRPFFKQRLYLNRSLNISPSDFPEIYPSADAENLGIYITGPGSTVPFSLLITNAIADGGLTSGNGSSPYIPRWRYEPMEALGQASVSQSNRVSNINPKALSEFRAHYSDDGITDDDLFHYVYGILHSAQYRESFANDLSKSQARIPMAARLADFRAFAQAGRELANLHVNYETLDPYPLEEIYADGWKPNAPDAYKVVKMKYPGKRPNLDKTRIAYSAGITLAGIPPKAHEYFLGTRSALDWLIERYQVKPHSASGIINDPNDWAAEVGEPRYIVDLIKRVATVSVRTVDIVNELPEFPMR